MTLTKANIVESVSDQIGYPKNHSYDLIETMLELIDALRDESRISKKEAAAIVDLFFGSISEALAGGDRVEIRGLCSFFVKEYKSYQGRNPNTGESVQVARKKLPFVKIGKELKERVDY